MQGTSNATKEMDDDFTHVDVDVNLVKSSGDIVLFFSTHAFFYLFFRLKFVLNGIKIVYCHSPNEITLICCLQILTKGEA